jgi:hypothetical protein
LKRRRLLQALASASGCVASGATWALPRGSVAAGDTMLAFAEALLGSEALTVNAREVLLEHLRLRTLVDARVAVQYRDCATLLDRLAGVPFATLPLKTRHDLLARHQLLPGAPAEAAGETARDLRLQIAPDLIAAYYRSPMGWAAVGYTAAFPGRCAGLEEYTRAPG